MKILITYASAKGTTQSIAERIESRITAAKIGTVTLQPAVNNPSISNFDILLIGSSIHAGSWLKPATKFIKNNASYLKEHPKPTWAFSVGMPKKGADESLEEDNMEKWIRKSIDLRGHKLFQGRWQPGDVLWGTGWLFRAFGATYEDRRDWDAIDAWADGIVNDLKNKSSV